MLFRSIATAALLTDLYEGTPEGVKVYKMKNESREEIEQPLEPAIKEKKGLKQKKLTREGSKSQVNNSPSPKKAKAIDAETPATSGAVSRSEEPPLMRLLWTSISLYVVTFCHFFQNMAGTFFNLPCTIKIIIYEQLRDSAVEEMWDRTCRYFSGNKGTKYSRRRKIIK